MSNFSSVHDWSSLGGSVPSTRASSRLVFTGFASMRRCAMTRVLWKSSLIKWILSWMTELKWQISQNYFSFSVVSAFVAFLFFIGCIRYLFPFNVCPLPLVVFKDEDEVRRCMNYSRWIFQRRRRSWDSLGLRLDSVTLSPIFRSTTNSKVFLVLGRALYQWYKFIAIIVTTPSTLNIIVSLLR